MTAVFLQLVPELTDVNGDAQNALVLARRAQWAGIDADVVALGLGEPAPTERPAAVVLGSSVDSAVPRLREGLEALRTALEDWIGAGVPLLAVGTGLELLGGRIPLADGAVEGLGLVPGSTEPLGARVADDLVVDAPEGRVIGYENHARGFRLRAGAAAFGTVVRGVGDGAGVDGLRVGSVLGTRLHGPVLAKNPALADAVLARALGREVRADSAAATAADAAAATIRRRLLGA